MVIDSCRFYENNSQPSTQALFTEIGKPKCFTEYLYHIFIIYYI